MSTNLYLRAARFRHINDPRRLFLLQIVNKAALQCASMRVDIQRISATRQRQQETVILLRLLRESSESVVSWCDADNGGRKKLNLILQQTITVLFCR